MGVGTDAKSTDVKNHFYIPALHTLYLQNITLYELITNTCV